jgi:hypothetical protein
MFLPGKRAQTALLRRCFHCKLFHGWLLFEQSPKKRSETGRKKEVENCAFLVDVRVAKSNVSDPINGTELTGGGYSWLGGLLIGRQSPTPGRAF